MILLLAACGLYDARDCHPAFDADEDGYHDCEDCAPFDPAVNLPRFYPDRDGDQHGDASAAPTCQERDNSTLADDCDDGDPAVFEATRWPDRDGDGFGDRDAAPTCAADVALSDHPDDCADGDPAVNPEAAERWNGVDDDCDGTIDQLGIDTLAPLPHLVSYAAERIGVQTRLTLQSTPDGLLHVDLVHGRHATRWPVTLPASPQGDVGSPSLATISREDCVLGVDDPDCSLLTGAFQRPLPGFADWDGDGQAELGLTSYANPLLIRSQVQVYSSLAWTAQDDRAWVVALPADLAGPAFTQLGERTGAFADLDGDGTPELVSALTWAARSTFEPEHGQLLVFDPPLTPDPAFLGLADATHTLWGEAGERLGTVLQPADLDGDDREDLIIGGDLGRVLHLVPGAAIVRSDYGPGELPAAGQIVGDAEHPIGATFSVVEAAHLGDDPWMDLVIITGARAWVFDRARAEIPARITLDEATLTLSLEPSSLPAGACMADGWLLVGDPGATSPQGVVRAGAVRGWRAEALAGPPAVVLYGYREGMGLGTAVRCAAATRERPGVLLLGAAGWSGPEGPYDSGALYLLPLPG